MKAPEIIWRGHYPFKNYMIKLFLFNKSYRGFEYGVAMFIAVKLKAGTCDLIIPYQLVNWANVF